MSRLAEMPAPAAPAAISTPAPAAAPSAATPPPLSAPSTLIPTPAERPTLSPSKAFGLPELASPSSQIDDMLKGVRDRAGLGHEAVPGAPAAPKAAPAPRKAPTGAPAAPATTETEEEPVNPASVAPATAPAEPSAVDKQIAELQKQLAELKSKENAPAPAPAAPTAPAETPEQVAARAAQVQKAENDFIERHAPGIDFKMRPDEVDAINAGGPEAIEALESFGKRIAATALLHSRKSIYGDLDPDLNQLGEAVGMLLNHHQQIVRYQAQTTFVEHYPELKPHLDLATNIASRLANGDNGANPDWAQWWAKATDEAKLKEVAEQTERILDDHAKRFGYTSWRQMPPPAAAAPGVPVQQIPAAAVPVTPTVPAVPLAPAATGGRPVPPVTPPRAPAAPRPPAGHAPGGAGAPAGGASSGLQAFNRAAALDVR